jgi:hypothetical protein
MIAMNVMIGLGGDGIKTGAEPKCATPARIFS